MLIELSRFANYAKMGPPLRAPPLVRIADYTFATRRTSCSTSMPRLSFYMMVGPLVFCRASQALWLQPCRDAAPASIAGSSSSATTRVPSLRRCLPRASTSTPSQRADKADFICFQDADFTCPSSRRSISYARALHEVHVMIMRAQGRWQGRHSRLANCCMLTFSDSAE